MHPLRDLLAPPACLGCGSAGADLCATCRRALPWLPDPRCRRCGLPGCGGGGRQGAAGGSRARGRGCPAAAQAFAASWAPLAYAGPVPALVAGLKERRARVAGEPMVAAMARAPRWLTGAAPVLVPVPTAAGRVRSRGFDHAVALAAGLAQRGAGELSACLVRAGPATRQRGARRAERLETERLAVALRPGAALPADAAARTCVLVDDVHTTGASLDACARALVAAGAGRVVALTCARTL